MTDALFVGGPLDGEKCEVRPGPFLTVALQKELAVPTGLALPSTVTELVNDTWRYRLENFRSPDKSANARDAYLYVSDELSTHEAMMKLIDRYKP
jgi:hypothetical protein